ncbi:hypothetical protein FXO37_09246 [Capsicum annuum]|nr:hypothetical protein FXO37_09246 [Capsicum annuum]
MPVTMFMILNVLLHESGNNSIYTIASGEQSANNDNGSETEDENIEIPGKYQQAEVDDDGSDLLEEDNQTEVNFDEEGNIVKKKLHNFISPTLIQPVTSANDISNHQKKGKEVNTLLPLDEPLDASTPNKALDDILGKVKHINAMPSKGVDDLQGTVFISKLPFDVDYGDVK